MAGEGGSWTVNEQADTEQKLAIRVEIMCLICQSAKDTISFSLEYIVNDYMTSFSHLRYHKRLSHLFYLQSE